MFFFQNYFLTEFDIWAKLVWFLLNMLMGKFEILNLMKNLILAQGEREWLLFIVHKNKKKVMIINIS